MQAYFGSISLSQGFTRCWLLQSIHMPVQWSQESISMRRIRTRSLGVPDISSGSAAVRIRETRIQRAGLLDPSQAACQRALNDGRSAWKANIGPDGNTRQGDNRVFSMRAPSGLLWDDHAACDGTSVSNADSVGRVMRTAYLLSGPCIHKGSISRGAQERTLPVCLLVDRGLDLSKVLIVSS